LGAGVLVKCKAWFLFQPELYCCTARISKGAVTLQLAELKGVDFEDFAREVTETSKSFFNLP